MEDTTPPLEVNVEPMGHNAFTISGNSDATSWRSEATIWRYLDFAKLISLLDSERLFFAASSVLEDQFEGSFPKVNITKRERHWRELGDKSPAKMVAREGTRNRLLRRFVFANCWNLSESESTALWGLYVPASGGVAVRSTVNRLLDSFDVVKRHEDEETIPVIIGKVAYVDYDHDSFPEDDAYYPFFNKRQSFRHESELRAIVSRIPGPEVEVSGGWEPIPPEDFFKPGPMRRLDYSQSAPAAVKVAVDLECLIAAIHVSPVAPSWFADLVRAVVERFGHRVDVIQSSLTAEPLF